MNQWLWELIRDASASAESPAKGRDVVSTSQEQGCLTESLSSEEIHAISPEEWELVGVGGLVRGVFAEGTTSARDFEVMLG